MLDHILTRAKAYAALVGSVLTAAAALYVDSKPLALAAAVCTAIATYAVPNTDGPTDEAGAITLADACLVVIAGVLLLGWLGIHGHVG